MTPADRLHLADDALAACSEAPDTADLRPDLRARALAYAAAWHEVNGATLRAEIETAAVQEARGLAVSLATVTKERDDLHAAYKLLGDSHGRVTDRAEQAEQARAEAIDKLTATFAEGRAAGHEAERKAWQDATDQQTPEAAKEWLDRAERVASDIARQRDQARARAEAAEEAKNIATVAMGLAETRAKEATTRAEQAEREVARLKAEATRSGPATLTEDDVDNAIAACRSWTPMDDDGSGEDYRAVSSARAARELWSHLPAHGRADATRPATVSPDDLLAEIEKVDDTGGQVWLSAVEIVLARHAGSVIGPVTTEATRPAPTPDASDEEIAEALVGKLADARACRPWGGLPDETTKAITAAIATVVRPRLDALRAEVARLTEARATVPAFDLPAIAWTTYANDNGEWSLCASGKSDDPAATVERAVALLTGRAEVTPVEPDRTGEEASIATPTPAPRYVAVPRAEVGGRPANVQQSEEGAARYARVINDGLASFHADETRPEFAGHTSWPWAVVDTGGGR